MWRKSHKHIYTNINTTNIYLHIMEKKDDIKKYALMGILVAFKENNITLNEVIKFIEDEYKKE